MRKNTVIILSCLLVAAFLVYVSAARKSSVCERSNKIECVMIAGKMVRAEIVATPEARAHGLSGRQGLKEGEGMLFVFDQPGHYDFWMKDMNFSIDIMWIKEDMTIAHMQKNASPESYPESFRSDEDAKYVLEVPAGFADQYQLKVGNSVIFSE